MTTVIKLKDLETKFNLTSNEILDLIYCHRVDYIDLVGMSETERKNSYLSYSRCLEEKNYEK